MTWEDTVCLKCEVENWVDLGDPSDQTIEDVTQSRT